MSIKYKIALLFAVLVTLFVTIMSASVYFVSSGEREVSFNKRLKNRALSTAKVYAGTKDNNFSVLSMINTAAVASLYKKSITIINDNGLPEYFFSDSRDDSLNLTAKEIADVKKEGEYLFNFHKQKAAAIYYNEGKEGNFIIAVAAYDIDGNEYLFQLRKTLFIALLLATVFSFFCGLAFAKSVISPIKRMTGEVNLITSNNLSKHIKITRPGDELTKLAQTFNNLLDRLQESFTIQRNFISNASHELSTPLTSISSQLEVAMQNNRSNEEYLEVIQSVYEDIKELHQLTHSLLNIAKTGSHGSIDLNEVRVDEILFKVISDIKKQNEAYKIALNFEVFPDNEKLLTVFGNANLLYIALKNIIENGCKYGGDHQSVVGVLFDKSAIIIKVSNNGDIIAEADIENIFQPFFRAETAQNKPGFGLGLTLTKRILSLHKATVEVESALEKGTVFTLTIPTILFSA
ncbi:MAG: HAMP domain-containing sensor histidine kinase [Ferruginibacter sp.]